MHDRKRNRRTIIAIAAAAAVAAAAFAFAPAFASDNSQVQAARDSLANCELLAANSTGAQQARAMDCATDQARIIQLLTSGTPTPTVQPSSPTPTTPPPGGHQLNCAPKPSSCGYPDATNTGVPTGTALTVVTGDQTIRTAGTVIDGKDIRGCVTVAAANVTVRRSKITCRDAWAIRSYRDDYTAGGLVIEDVEVSCDGTQGTGIASYGFVARRVDVSKCENGFAIDNDVTVEDSYIHDLYLGRGGHTDGMQFAGGAHMAIRHNTIFNPNDGGTSAIIMNETDMADLLVSNNLMAGGAYTLYCPKEASSNVRVLDNRFSRLYKPMGGEYGPWVYCENIAQVAGNTWDEDGKPL